MDNVKPVSAFIPQSAHGSRLDAALGAFYPQLGLRARRRIWDWCRITLDGRAAGPGETVRAGQLLEVAPDYGADAGVRSQLWNYVRLLDANEHYCAVFKPGGLPSARIEGGASYSVEDYVRENWPDLRRDFLPEAAPLLCNRLDTPTSGLLLWAFGPLALERFKMLEAAGAVEKHYYALVRGAAPEELYIDLALDTAGRKKTQALDHADPDKARHSLIKRLTLSERQGEAVSLVDVTIRRGARHQIRAHLASAGHPIVGDALYGGPEDSTLHLHHYRITFEGFSAEDPGSGPFTASSWADFR